MGTITSANLTGCRVFFTSVFTGNLSSSEASALKTAVAAGMKVITDADTPTSEQDAVNSLLAAVGFTGTVGSSGGSSCGSGGAQAASVRLGGAGNPALYGPFGDLRGNSWGITQSAKLSGLGLDVGCPASSGTDPVRAVKGNVMVGGDPDAFDIFTTTTSSQGNQFYNPTDEAAYLNFIGNAH